MSHNFYTNVARLGSKLLVRGYEDGKRFKRKVSYKPTLYVKGKGNSKFHALDGTNVDPIHLDSMYEAKEFVEKYTGVEGFTIYGNTNHIPAYIAEAYPGVIQFNRQNIRVHTVDLECDSSGQGFPKPEEAKYPITAITIHDSILDTHFSWGLTPFDKSKLTKLKTTSRIVYLKCKDEESLLSGFLKFWSDEFAGPDIVTGWNIRTFDIPYIANRIHRLLGEDQVKRLSPWGMVEQKTISMMKGQTQVYDLMGINQLDYLDLFKKFGFSFGPQENYRLETIANVVLGTGKIDYSEYGSLTNLYEENPQLYQEYNIYDVELVVQMEKKIGLISLACTMAYKGSVNYNDVFGTVGIWDAIIHKELLKDNIILNPSVPSFKQDFEGGYVKDTIAGAHDWVCSFDVNSLYPSVIVQWNMSPETILNGDIKPNINPMACLNGAINDDPVKTMAATGQYFDKTKQGFMPRIVEQLLTERKVIKSEMLKFKQELEIIDKSDIGEVYRLESAIAQAENGQTAIKLILNSLYGAMGNRFFRHFSLPIAEGITITGQTIIQFAEKRINEYLNKVLSTNKDYVIAQDTDSAYVVLSDLVNKVLPNGTQLEKVDFLDKACKQIEKNVLSIAFKDIANNLGVYKHFINMKREAIASRGIFLAKKRYILNVLDNEGVRYAEPKMKMVGIEAIKSSTPQHCRDAFKSMFKILINGTEEETQAFVANFKKEFFALPPEDKARPGGVTTVKALTDSKTIYKQVKGTVVPINSRASILYNHLLKQKNIENKYETISDGDKIKYLYLNPRNPTRENVIAFVQVLPKEFGLHQYIDNETQFEKTFFKGAEAIVSEMGWSIEPKSDLESFFE